MPVKLLNWVWHHWQLIQASITTHGYTEIPSQVLYKCRQWLSGYPRFELLDRGTLRRWTLLATPWFKLYLHQLVPGQGHPDLHDHPKRFMSIGLWGTYKETTEEVTYRGVPWNDPWVRTEKHKVFTAPWIRHFSPEHQHKVEAINGPCWSLCFVGQRVKEWGFWSLGRFIPWKVYKERRNHVKSSKEQACQL